MEPVNNSITNTDKTRADIQREFAALAAARRAKERQRKLADIKSHFNSITSLALEAAWSDDEQVLELALRVLSRATAITQELLQLFDGEKA